ncbi:MAG: hypothetical protein RSC48_05955 [Anaerorhabdus sp.]
MTIEFDNIIRVADSSSADVTNQYLNLGWKLLQVSKSEYGIQYALGWDASNGEVKDIPKFCDELDLPY